MRQVWFLNGNHLFWFKIQKYLLFQVLLWWTSSRWPGNFLKFQILKIVKLIYNPHLWEEIQSSAENAFKWLELLLLIEQILHELKHSIHTHFLVSQNDVLDANWWIIQVSKVGISRIIIELISVVISNSPVQNTKIINYSIGLTFYCIFHENFCWWFESFLCYFIWKMQRWASNHAQPSEAFVVFSFFFVDLYNTFDNYNHHFHYWKIKLLLLNEVNFCIYSEYKAELQYFSNSISKTIEQYQISKSSRRGALEWWSFIISNSFVSRMKSIEVT